MNVEDPWTAGGSGGAEAEVTTIKRLWTGNVDEFRGSLAFHKLRLLIMAMRCVIRISV